MSKRLFIRLSDNSLDVVSMLPIIEKLRQGGIVILPTDTIYVFAVSLNNKEGMDRLSSVKSNECSSIHFAMLFANLANLTEYVKPLERHTFALLKKNTPGPFTFMLETCKNLPKHVVRSKRDIGMRVPENKIIQTIIEELESPLLISSLHVKDDTWSYGTDPEIIFQQYNDKVDGMISSGYGGLIPSTIVECRSSPIEIIREGLGNLRF